MTPEELAAIRARNAARTQGKWTWSGRDDETLEPGVAYVAGPGEPSYLAISETDKSFIAACSEDVPALLAEVDRLRAALEAAKIRHATGDACDIPSRCREECTCNAENHNTLIDRALRGEA